MFPAGIYPLKVNNGNIRWLISVLTVRFVSQTRIVFGETSQIAVWFDGNLLCFMSKHLFSGALC